MHASAFPRVREDALGLREPSWVEQAISIQPRILVVDADVAVATRRCGQLSAHGWHVTHAFDELGTLQAAHGDAPDLALLRMRPEDLAAIDLPRVLRRVADTDYLPVVALTSDDTAATREAFLDMGVDDVLSERMPPGELRERLDVLLRLKALQDALASSRRELEDALARERQLLEKIRQDNRQLSQMVVTDPLTGLYNLRYFQSFLDDEFKIARRYGHPISLLVLDLDHFKRVNDRFGHPAGDNVLREFAKIMRQIVRESDVVARTGGEEFAVILPRADRTQADEFARRILSELAGHEFSFGRRGIRVTCSVGLAGYPADDVGDPIQLFFCADQALLAAKRAGRNRVVSWGDMEEPVRRALHERFAAGAAR